MRCTSLLLVIALARVAAAESDDEIERGAPEVPAGESLVRADQAAWRYQLITAPALAPQVGALALSGLDVVAGRAQQPIDVLGGGPTVPAAWPYGLDTVTRATGTLEPTPPAQMRIAAMYAITTFTLAPEDRGLRVLEIRVRYHDGCSVYLNGIEVARRSLADNASPVALAQRPHGPEWETFYVPAAPHLLRLGENVLAIEVHPSGKRDAPDLAADVVARRELGVVRGPVLADVTATSATINVETDASIDAVLEWGTGTTLDHKVSSTVGRLHAFTLTNLPPKTKLSYRVIAGAATTATYAFHTAPGAGDVIRIGVYGDVRGGHDTHRRLVEAMLGEGIDLVAVTGDMVLRGTDDADWQKFFAVTRELLAQIHYVPAIGNHDVGLTNGEANVFTLPPAPPGRPERTYWYSMELADIHLVFLDSNAYDRSEQEQWLDADLAAARGKNVRAILAFTHDGPYSRGTHRGNETARDRFVPILAKYHVDLVVAGHDHLYQRGDAGGIRYIVSGGGGAGLYQVSCGVSGKPKCPDDGMQKVLVEHHYLVLAITNDTLEMCPRKADGRLLEKCVRYKLWRP
ncbi:MAG TPA: metallophosphoesterase [Kofleriaceae bacterium]|nr:metallophosphoesterase [Kofleriaceae bacterium]